MSERRFIERVIANLLSLQDVYEFHLFLEGGHELVPLLLQLPVLCSQPLHPMPASLA